MYFVIDVIVINPTMAVTLELLQVSASTEYIRL